MKRVVCAIGLVLCALSVSTSAKAALPDSTGNHESICITTEFAVDVTYPNFWTSALARIAGAHTNSFTFVEWETRSSDPTAFLLQLTDDGDERWFDIAGDTTFPSFLKLPLEDRLTLGAGVLNFVGELIRFTRTVRRDTLHTIFEYGRDSLGATGYQVPMPAVAGSSPEIHSHVSTWDVKTGEEYIVGESTAGLQDGCMIYHDITVHLKKRDVTYRLTSTRVSVVRSKF